MNKSLGERIKALRKELKMTQTELAGSEMTKSMLSQIENNLAMPSMKNLQYLAARLGKLVSYFLEDIDYQDSLPVEKIHKELENVTQLMRSSNLDKALAALESMLSEYNFDRSSKLYADFLLKYGECLIELNRIQEAEDKIKEAADIYKSKFLFVDAAKAHIDLIDIPWKAFDYGKCMDILDEALLIYSNSINKDYAFEIETLYIRSVLCVGLDNLEDGHTTASKALSISKQTNIYYKSDELYKNLAVICMYMGNSEHFDEYIDKAREFAVFTENKDVLASIEGVCALRCNQLNRSEEALEHLERAEKFTNKVAPFVNAEKAKTYYMLGSYERAIDAAGHMKYPSYALFRYDYLHICSAKIYEGLSLNKLGSPKEAIDSIKQGINKLEVVGTSKALAFAYRSLSEVYSNTGDFEKAFSTLKKANEIEEAAKQQKLYY